MLRKSLAFVGLFVVSLIAGLTGSVTAQETPASTAEVLAALAPPADATLAFELYARGVQIYVCAADPETAGSFVWTFKAPEAQLLNVRGEVVGRHFAGPTWQGHDGSIVAGKVLKRAVSPDPTAIPWLLLEAKYTAGTGIFSTITYVQRLDTEGGIAPTSGCDDATAGEVARRSYEATYAFYYPSAPLELSPID